MQNTFIVPAMQHGCHAKPTKIAFKQREVFLLPQMWLLDRSTEAWRFLQYNFRILQAGLQGSGFCPQKTVMEDQ